MSPDESRRFTDREVALVLRKASELEESEGSGGGGGLTQKELEQIATEVGISTTLVQRAISDLDARVGKNPFAPGQLTHQAIRAVPGELDQESVARLIHHVDGSSDQVGVVTEALGSTQWTASDRFRTTQVSITPSKGETRVRVVERATNRLRRLIQAVPTMTGAALMAGTVGAMNPSSLEVAGLSALGAALGAIVGRVGWSYVSAQRAVRVERLATELTREAGEAARRQGGTDTPTPGGQGADQG